MTLSLHEPIVEPCPAALTAAHHEQYRQLGYLAFEQVLSPHEVEAARAALANVAGGLMAALRAGEARVETAPPGATKNYAGPKVVRTGGGAAIHFEAGVDPAELSEAEAQLRYRKLHDYADEHPTFQSLVGHPRIQGVLAELIGEPMRLKATMALSKPPRIGSEKPWHQDNAYFNWLPLDRVATAWIALDDATVANGCMHLLPGQHTRGALRHHHTIDCEILPDRIDPSQAVPVELRAGGALFFSAMLPHQTPPNTSSEPRRALQFQYRGASCREVSKEEFGHVFAEADGRPASCALAHENG